MKNIMEAYSELTEKFETSPENPIVSAYYQRDKKKQFSTTTLSNLAKTHKFMSAKYLKDIQAGKLVPIEGRGGANKMLYVQLASVKK